MLFETVDVKYRRSDKINALQVKLMCFYVVGGMIFFVLLLFGVTSNQRVLEIEADIYENRIWSVLDGTSKPFDTFSLYLADQIEQSPNSDVIRIESGLRGSLSDEYGSRYFRYLDDETYGTNLAFATQHQKISDGGQPTVLEVDMDELAKNQQREMYWVYYVVLYAVVSFGLYQLCSWYDRRLRTAGHYPLSEQDKQIDACIQNSHDLKAAYDSLKHDFSMLSERDVLRYNDGYSHSYEAGLVVRAEQELRRLAAERIALLNSKDDTLPSKSELAKDALEEINAEEVSVVGPEHVATSKPSTSILLTLVERNNEELVGLP